MMRPVLVTGGTGFVGRHLLADLRGRSGPVIAAGRDLAPETDWQDLLDGVDSVVHLAAAAHRRAEVLERKQDYETMRRVNALATERLARQAAQCGARHFVFLSTIGVCGDETSGEPITEQTSAQPRSLYAASKLEAERRLGEVARETGLRVTVLRPTLVYGPGNGGNMLRLLRLAHGRWPLPLASIRNRRSLTFVGNLVSAIGAVLALPQCSGTYVVCDRDALSTPQLIRGLAEGMGRSAALFPCPVKLLRAAGRLTGRRDEIRRLTGSLEADATKLSRLLGWHPPFDAEDAVRKTGAWFRTEYRPEGSG